MPVLVKRGYEDAITAEALLRVKARKERAESTGNDPSDIEGWFADVLGFHLYPKQREMVEAARDSAQVSACGCNSSGKDATAGRIALWWMKYWHHRGDPAKVIITAPTGRQISHIVWQETRKAYLHAEGCCPLGGQLYEPPYLKWDEENYILGFSTDKPYQLQGHHSPHLLVIVSEAHGVAQSHIDVLWRLNPNCMLLTGNPISESGEFYDSHHGKSHLWHTIDINAWDTPNVIEGREVVPGLVTLEDIARGKRNWGEDSPLYRITFKDEWVEGMGQQVVVPLSLARLAEDNWECGVYEVGQVGVLGVDVARHGTDKTVIYLRRGRVARKLWEAQGAPTTETSEWLIEYHHKHPFVHVVVDGVGVGGGVIDQLRRAQVGVIEFQGGASASDSTHYWDRNAEVWWRMREAYQAGLAIEPDGELRAQVSSRRYKIEKDRRIRLERKEDMKKEGRHSPDEADAFAMTFVLDWQIGTEHITPGSDVGEQTKAWPDEMLIGSAGARQSLSFGRRGNDMAPRVASRWGSIRKGHKR